MISLLSSSILTLIIALAAIAFFTLLERKALGYFQLRKGPNKARIMGVPLPLADAVKLFSKELSSPLLVNYTPFLLSPFLRLILTLLLWALAPSVSPNLFIKFGVLFFLAVSRLNVYTTLAAGWASNSKYSLLGALRGVAQTISYEVRISLILLATLIFIYQFNFQILFQNYIIYSLLIIPLLFYIWFTTALAETNRTPFDFAEGERELVSGFNTEYSGGTFAIIFIAEYINIIIISLFSVIFFIGNIMNPILNSIFFVIKIASLSFLFIWVRASFPRLRYDQLINLTWKSFLSISLIFLIILPQFIV